MKQVFTSDDFSEAGNEEVIGKTADTTSGHFRLLTTDGTGQGATVGREAVGLAV